MPNEETFIESPVPKLKMSPSAAVNGQQQLLLAGKRLRILENQVILRKGTFYGPVVRGMWKDDAGKTNQEKEVAATQMRTADCQENWMDIIQKHQNGSLNHDNVLEIFGFDDNPGGSWRLVV
jgi:hypothetical protein